MVEKEPENKRKRRMAGNQVAPHKRTKRDDLPDNLVRVEIFRKNDKLFDGRLGRENIVDLWTQALRRKADEIDGFASIQIRGRALRINYRLKKSVVVSTLFTHLEFEWERSSSVSNEVDFFTGKILGLSSQTVKIGDTVTVCINRTALEFTDDQLKAWMNQYGTVEGRFNYQLDKLGYKTDELEVELKLKKDIPEFLPMYGRKIRIFYIGMKRQCINCYEIGHLKADCPSDKKDWFGYIETLTESEDFDAKLFGDRPGIIENKRKNGGQNTRGRGGTRGGRGRGRGRGN
jgi:hypothetical protein